MPATFFAQLGYAQLLRVVGDVRALPFVMVNPGALAVADLAPFIAIQLVRSRFEERLLTKAYPHYQDYALRTRRLIPFIW